MCMEDIKIGRNLNTECKFAVPGAGGRVLIGNPNRVAIVMSSGGTAIAFAGPQSCPPLTDRGLTFSTANPIIRIDIETYGSIVKEEWFIHDGGSGEAFMIVESILPAQKPSDLRG